MQQAPLDAIPPLDAHVAAAALHAEYCGCRIIQSRRMQAPSNTFQYSESAIPIANNDVFTEIVAAARDFQDVLRLLHEAAHK